MPALEPVVLSHGSHESRDDGMCVMEAVAWLAGESHSDAPECASPVIAAFMRAWNDGIPDDATRTWVLLPYVTRLVGTRGDEETEQRRAWSAADWLVRTCAPAVLALVPSLESHATALRALPPIVSHGTAGPARARLTSLRLARLGLVMGCAIPYQVAELLGAVLAAVEDSLSGALQRAGEAVGDVVVECACGELFVSEGDRAVLLRVRASAIDLVERLIAGGPPR